MNEEFVNVLIGKYDVLVADLIRTKLQLETMLELERKNSAALAARVEELSQILANLNEQAALNKQEDNPKKKS